MTPRVSVVVPVHQEGEAVVPALERISREVHLPAEILVVHDLPDDPTVPYARQLAARDARIRTVHNTYGRGPANAIRFGIDTARAPVAVVTMADGSDDPAQIDQLTRLVERGVVVAAASRYMAGGQQIGGPRLKRSLSRTASLTLHLLARVGTRDATNSFKAYDTTFVQAVGIDSRTGFEVGLELTAKATRLRLPVAELPTIWLDRQLGDTHFDLARFLPGYLRWYRFAFGRRLRLDQLNARTPAGSAAAPDRPAARAGITAGPADAAPADGPTGVEPTYAGAEPAGAGAVGGPTGAGPADAAPADGSGTADRAATWAGFHPPEHPADPDRQPAVSSLDGSGPDGHREVRGG